MPDEVAVRRTQFNEITVGLKACLRIRRQRTLILHCRSDANKRGSLRPQTVKQQAQGRRADTSTLGIFLAKQDVHVDQLARQVRKARLAQLGA